MSLRRAVLIFTRQKCAFKKISYQRKTFGDGLKYFCENKKIYGNYVADCFSRTGAKQYSTNPEHRAFPETPDVSTFSKLQIKNASINNEVLALEFYNFQALYYPIVWLRDNCQCEQCYDPISKSRTIEQLHFFPDVKVSSMDVSDDILNIKWDSGHESSFTKEWLIKHSWDSNHQHQREIERHPQKTPWNAEQFLSIPACKRFSFQDIVDDDKVLLSWLEALAQYGVAHIEDAPQKAGQVEKLATRIAFIKKTHYGEDFNVKQTENANNVAYKAGPLQLHTDLPYYHYMPGVNLLHCIIQSSAGGESILSDGLNASKLLNPRAYRVLADTIVDWVDKGSSDGADFYSVHQAPVLCEDSQGNLLRVNWSQPQRDSHFNVTLEEAIEWYSAMKVWSNTLYDPKNMAKIKTKPGDILTFDNQRILHGRTLYTDGARHLIGAYVDWDEIYSRIRVLRNKFS